MTEDVGSTVCHIINPKLYLFCTFPLPLLYLSHTTAKWFLLRIEIFAETCSQTIHFSFLNRQGHFPKEPGTQTFHKRENSALIGEDSKLWMNAHLVLWCVFPAAGRWECQTVTAWLIDAFQCFVNSKEVLWCGGIGSSI